MTLLLLSGTGEAREIADMLADEGIPAIASLAGATRAPQEQALPTRIGGFGGADGFRRYLLKAQISAVLDATHPFAVRVSGRTVQICAKLGLPYCQLLRPEWSPSAQDQWIVIADEAEASAHVKPDETVFLATGRQTLERFAQLKTHRLYCRQIDVPDGPFPFSNGEYVIGRPPFSVEEEIALFQRLGIDWLVVKNAGGSTSFSKLIAARELGLRVLMISRPPQPEARRVDTVNAAMAWARAL